MIEMTDAEIAAPLVDPVLPSVEDSLSGPETQTEEAVTTGAEAQPKIVISQTLYEIFSEEAATHLATLQRELPVLEKDELTPTPHDMYRAAHTLAGISATVGIASVN